MKTCLCLVLGAQLCLTLCGPMDCTSPPWNSPGKNTGVGSPVVYLTSIESLHELREGQRTFQFICNSTREAPHRMRKAQGQQGWLAHPHGQWGWLAHPHGLDHAATQSFWPSPTVFTFLLESWQPRPSLRLGEAQAGILLLMPWEPLRPSL